MLANFSGIESERALSKFYTKRKKKLCCAHLPRIKRARETRNKCTKMRDVRASCCFADIKVLLFVVLVAIVVGVA